MPEASAGDEVVLLEGVDLGLPSGLDKFDVCRMRVVRVVGGLVGEHHRELPREIALGADLPVDREGSDARDGGQCRPPALEELDLGGRSRLVDEPEDDGVLDGHQISVYEPRGTARRPTPPSPDRFSYRPERQFVADNRSARMLNGASRSGSLAPSFVPISGRAE